MLGSVSHATVSAYGNEYINGWPDALKIAENTDGVVSAAPYVSSEAMLQGFRTTGALIQGIEPQYEKKVTQIAPIDKACINPFTRIESNFLSISTEISALFWSIQYKTDVSFLYLKSEDLTVAVASKP